MSLAFQSIKKSLALYDYINFGKYKTCRVDSVVLHDPNYLMYLSKVGVKIDPHVLTKAQLELEKKPVKSIVDDYGSDNAGQNTYDDLDDLGDIPF